MALTIAKAANGDDSTGRYRHRYRNITGDNAPPAGGYSLTGLQVGARNGSIIGAVKIGGNALASSYGVTWDTVNDKLIFTTGSGSVAPGTDLSGVTVLVDVITTA